MSKESSKFRAILTPDERCWFSGKGIDIGCGNDPITPDCQKFDISDGDANHITQYIHDTFDWVYSSHCLEHMYNPLDTLADWGNLLRSGGYMIVTVPDEDLYEQGIFPSRYNGDHKHTFTISKRQSWSPVSVNMLELARKLSGFSLVKLELHDMGYDRRISNIDQTLGDAMAQILMVLQKKPRVSQFAPNTGISISVPGFYK